MRAVQYLGEERYEGTDQGDGGRPISLGPGDVARVSATKATQLQRDFPDLFAFGSDVDPDLVPEPSAEEEEEQAPAEPDQQPPPPTEDLSKLNLAALIERAAALGIDVEPFQKPGTSKAQVREAIEAAQAA